MNRKDFKELFIKKGDGLPNKDCTCLVIENNVMPPHLRSFNPERLSMYGYYQEVTHYMIFDDLPTLKQQDVLEYTRMLSKSVDALKTLNLLTFD